MNQPPQPNDTVNPYPLRVSTVDDEPMPVEPYLPNGDHVCVVCGGDNLRRETAQRIGRTGGLVCIENCSNVYRAAMQEYAEQVRQWNERKRVRGMRDGLQRRLALVLGQLPQYRPRLGDPEFPRAVPHDKLRTLAAKYTADRGSLLLLGPSGCGKTTTVQAIVQRLATEVVESPVLVSAESGDWYSLGCLRSFVWTTGFAIAYARRNHSLGSEPELLVDAKRASLLVVDDVGSEPLADNVLFEVVNERYTQQLPTIVTSGLTSEGFIARYGDALDRRLTQPTIGAPVEIPPKKKASLNLVKP